MFLQPSEVGFLTHLKEARVPVVEFEFPAKHIVNIQSQLEKLIGQNYYLNQVRSFPHPRHYLQIHQLTMYDSLRRKDTDHTFTPTLLTRSDPSSTSTSLI